ncbi:tetratricopeptide repeat protein [uncultured Alistipes sp.]|uniref:tetratricopeptide repeat protein n=1 Tax=uncultured Alistipes sp. TaxID=538949 RepID=UPI000FFEAE03|nr:tetratricopeptide repeat protein [uncultured Alistipes sp.]
MGYILLAALVACVLIVVIARVSKRSTNSPETSDVPASLSIRVQGREYSIPTPDADKLTAWSERKEANETNPDSCETMPGEGETLVPVSFFAPGCGLAGWSKYEDYWEACNRASWNGYNNIVVSVADYEEAEAYKAEAERRERLLYTTAELNNKGLELEKRGEVPAAIATYEECIKLRYPAFHAYWRLCVLYRKAKDKENELRVIRVALDVFPDDEKFTARLNKVLAMK